MDKEIYFKLANAADSLANEYEKGEGPITGVMRFFWLNEPDKPCCAMGHVLHRAGLSGKDVNSFAGGEMSAKVVNANDSNRQEDRPKALIKPLRDLANAWRNFYNAI